MEQVYRCIVCGHTLTIEEYNSMPEDYVCPDCGVGKSDYELVDF
jgi:rubredoxin